MYSEITMDIFNASQIHGHAQGYAYMLVKKMDILYTLSVS